MHASLCTPTGQVFRGLLSFGVRPTTHISIEVQQHLGLGHGRFAGYDHVAVLMGYHNGFRGHQLGFRIVDVHVDGAGQILVDHLAYCLIRLLGCVDLVQVGLLEAEIGAHLFRRHLEEMQQHAIGPRRIELIRERGRDGVDVVVAPPDHRLAGLTLQRIVGQVFQLDGVLAGRD